MTSQASHPSRSHERSGESAVDTIAIGNTPCIRVNRVAPKQVWVYVKADFLEPAGFIKDRVAIRISRGPSGVAISSRGRRWWKRPS
jgi:cysteine synthase A